MADMAEEVASADLPVIFPQTRNVRPQNIWQNDPSLANTSWREWPLIRLRIEGLPPSTTTFDVYNNLAGVGNITRITLGEERPGQRTVNSEVTFEPPPEDLFWDGRSLEFTTGDWTAYPCVYLDRYQPPSNSIESPVRRGVAYNERNELYGKSLGFGILASPNMMYTMASRGDACNPVKFVLNLRKKEIEVYFPVTHVSNRGTAQREFRFVIALDDQLTIWSLPGENYVLYLSKPPRYSKKLIQAVANTHSQGARRWSSEDMWARQTDMFTYTSANIEINDTPVALPKDKNDINIFRWTTFHFQTLSQARADGSAKTFFDALHDWNINVQDGESFKVKDWSQVSLRTEKDTWNLINSTHDDKTAYSLSEELSRISLPFSVRYQLEVCLSHAWLSEYSITPEFLRRLSDWGEMRAKQALVYVATNQNRLHDPMVIFDDVQYTKPVRPKALPNSCIEIYSATVTATGILFHTPSVEVTNRIVRNHKAHAHRFLRVRFADDDYRGQSRLHSSTNNKMGLIYQRVRRALTMGIMLGNIKYDFLASGNSQLREHGAYFFAATENVNADRIRAEMGNFEEVVVAKKCARMGQCFSSTKTVHLQLPPITMANVIPDIIRAGYNFTDGVGKISPVAASLVSNQLGFKNVPSLFQFRLGGCKGVLAVSKDVPGKGVLIRKSQFKFSSLSGELEIIRCAEYWQAFLNRQIILCLNNLGVPPTTFLEKQNEVIKALERALQDDGAAVKALRTNVDPNRMTLSLAELVEAGFRARKDPFVNVLLHLWQAWSLKYLKEKAKIPVTEGAFVLGTVDETATLRGHTTACPTGDREHIERNPSYMDDLPEIFLQITDPQTGQRRIIEGLCILARNPSLHTGDIRVVRAVNVSCLRHLCDVVVMPQTGDRDLPSMCSGGDLDGDDYIVIWDKALIPAVWNAEPFHYEAPVPMIAEGVITTGKIIDFFVDYLQNDSIGLIATAHLAAADDMPDSLRDRSCLELAALHSMAVDYPKTGVPAVMERRHERNRWPHFMEKKYSNQYHSYKVLGQLYDAVQQINFAPNWNLPFDSRILLAFKPSEDLFEIVQNVKRDYDNSLRQILNQHEIGTEFELWSTFVLNHSKAAKDFKFHEEVGMLSRTLKEQFYNLLVDIAKGKDYDHLAPVAVAAYQCTHKQLQRALKEVEIGSRKYQPECMPFISFPWVLQDTLTKIAVRASDTNLEEVVAIAQNERATQSNGADNINAGDDDLVDLQDIGETRFRTYRMSEHLPDPHQPRVSTEVKPQVYAGDISLVDTSIPAKSETAMTSDNTMQNSAESPELPVQPDVSDREIENKNSVFSSQPVASEIRTNEAEDIPNRNRGSESRDETRDALAALKPKNFISIGGLTSHDYSSEISRSLDGAASTESPIEELSYPHHKPSIIQTPHEIGRHDRFDPRSEKRLTCHFWKVKNNCMYTADVCHRAHWDTGHYEPALEETCWFWKQYGHCLNNAEDCLFAHYDTGFVAPRPNRAVASGTKARGAMASLRKRMVVEDSDSSDDEEHVDNGLVRPTTSETSRETSPATDSSTSPIEPSPFEPAKGHPSTYVHHDQPTSFTNKMQNTGHELHSNNSIAGRLSIHYPALQRFQSTGSDDGSDLLKEDPSPSKISNRSSTKNTAKLVHRSDLDLDPKAIPHKEIPGKNLVDADDVSTLSGFVPPSRPLIDPFENPDKFSDFGSDIVFG